MRKDTVVNSFMFNANFLNRIKLIGSGNQKRVFVSLANVVVELSSLVNSTQVGSGTYNLVGHTLSIGELAEEVKKLYPELEMITVNQHLTMRQVLVANSTELRQYSAKSLSDELQKFREKFTFHLNL